MALGAGFRKSIARAKIVRIMKLAEGL